MNIKRAEKVEAIKQILDIFTQSDLTLGEFSLLFEEEMKRRNYKVMPKAMHGNTLNKK